MTADSPIAVFACRPSCWLRWVLVLLAIAGCVICLVLIRLAAPIAAPAKIFGANVCPTTGTINCDYVLNSRWAYVGPIPTSVLGLAYFGLVALWFAAIGVPSVSGRRWHLLPLFLVIAGACGSLGLLYVLAFELPVWCTWCVAAHVVNLWILIFTILAWPRRSGLEADLIAAIPLYPTRARVAAVLGFAVALLWIILATLGAYYSAVLLGRTQTQFLKAVNNSEYVVWRSGLAKEQDIPIRPDDPSLGPPDAAHTIVVFSDFQCPHCRGFSLLTDALLERFPGKVRFVFKHFPLATECNPHVTRTVHFFSCAAAQAAEAARTVAGDELLHLYYRKLFDNMNRLDTRPYERLAGQVGIDRARFASAMKDGVGKDRIQEDIELGKRLGIESTPGVFLDGRLLPTWNLVKSDSGLSELAVDSAATMKLWERLLGEEPSSQPASTMPES